MRLASPTFTLVSLLAAAALVLGGGWRLARRSVAQHVSPDRAALRELATQLQRELLQLEALFQLDLRDLAAQTASADESRFRALCDSLYGIVQFSRVTGDPARDRHWPGGSAAIVLPPEDVSPTGQAPDFGWSAPRDPRFWTVWKRLDDKTVAAFLIDRREIVGRVDFFLREWLARSPAPARAAKSLYRLETPAGGSLAGATLPPGERQPEMVLPLVCRFGDWQIAAWDQIATRTFFDPATLAVAFTVAALLAALGFLLFWQQRRAARLAEQRVSFVNCVSHELGAPLTNILLNLDLIEEELAGLSEATRQRLHLVSEEARRLSRLVGNVLTFSRRKRRRLQPGPQVPDEIVEAVLQQFRPALTRRGIATGWKGAAKTGMPLDADAFAQVIANLISNAEKYAAEGQWLGIESRMENDQLIVQVADRGPGIPAAHALRIFEPFERVDSRVSEGATGAGLGLSIARDLAQEMGGQLRLLASARGALFELCLPMGGR